MIDLNAIKHRHLDPERMKGRTYYAGHLELDLAALVDEVERLRSINDDYLLEMGRQHALLREQKRGENAERAAVVAWLREAAYTTLYDARAWDVADAIERGEHRREEGT